MAANPSPSPSSSSPPDHHNIPTAQALPAANAVTATRRLPPCWTPDETVALIDAYRDKWYSLRRSNLRATHWQEVAKDVASRCPAASPRKTAVQCRHKMEKLRKRYRAEIQRAAARGGIHRFSTTWDHFQNMHAMEKGPNTNPTPPSSSSSDQDADDDDERINSINDLCNNSHNQKGIRGGFQQPVDYGSSPGFRFKIPEGKPKAYNMFDEIPSQTLHQSHPKFHHSGYWPSSNLEGFFGRSEIGKRTGEVPKRKKAASLGSELAAAIQALGEGFMGMEKVKMDMGKRTGEVPKRKKAASLGSELTAAIQALGEGFMRMEKVKMDMARQIEEIWMDMQLKRTEMILESQQRIVEAFAKSISEKGVSKKAKRMQHPMPDC